MFPVTSLLLKPSLFNKYIYIFLQQEVTSSTSNIPILKPLCIVKNVANIEKAIKVHIFFQHKKVKK